jgi:hypothetical protein
MANLVKVTEAWVADQVQGYVISLGVTSRNFESAKQVTRDYMFNRAIPRQMTAYLGNFNFFYFSEEEPALCNLKLTSYL